MSTDDKIDAIFQEITAQKVHREQHRKELDKANEDIKALQKNQNLFFGACSVIGTGLSALFAYLFKH